VVSAAVAALIAFAVQFQLGQNLPPLLRLIIGCGILFAVYTLILLYAMGQKDFYLDLVRGLANRSPVEENSAAVS